MSETLPVSGAQYEHKTYDDDRNVLVQCKECGHVWVYNGYDKYSQCSQCRASNTLTNPEVTTQVIDDE